MNKPTWEVGLAGAESEEEDSAAVKGRNGRRDPRFPQGAPVETLAPPLFPLALLSRVAGLTR